jgi:hypothetical protein
VFEIFVPLLTVFGTASRPSNGGKSDDEKATITGLKFFGDFYTNQTSG